MARTISQRRRESRRFRDHDLKTRFEHWHQPAYIQAHNSLEKYRIQIERDFNDPFYNTANDVRYVEDREKRFKEEESPEQQRLKEAATVLEAIIIDQIRMADWFGEDTHIVPASRYDDIANGVDAIMEVDKEAARYHLALGIDVTFSDGKPLQQKMRSIKKEIERGTLTQVKYFVSPIDGTRSWLKRIPRVIIGADMRTLEEVTQLWMNQKRDQEKKMELLNHPLKHQLLLQMDVQLKAYRAFAHNMKTQRDEGIVTALDRAIKVVEMLKKEQGSDLLSAGQFDQDRVYAGIRNLAVSFASL